MARMKSLTAYFLGADLHRLFDKVNPELKIEVSKRLQQDFANGHSYYPLHGGEMGCPANRGDWPDLTYLRWQNENIYLGGITSRIERQARHV